MIRDILNRFSSYISPSQTVDPPKRNVLVIHCHPVEDSFSNALLVAVTSGLQSSGQNVRIRRLYPYKQNVEESYTNDKTGIFAPQLSREERIEYFNDSNKSSEISKAVADLRWANALVLVYPTWWFNFPASLKGYFDRVFLPGVAFKLPSASDSVKATQTGLLPGLTNISKIGVVTTYGASRAIVFYAGDGGRALLDRGLRPLFHPSCTMLHTALYNMDSTTLEERKAHLKHVEETYRRF